MLLVVVLAVCVLCLGRHELGSIGLGGWCFGGKFRLGLKVIVCQKDSPWTHGELSNSLLLLLLFLQDFGRILV